MLQLRQWPDTGIKALEKKSEKTNNFTSSFNGVTMVNNSQTLFICNPLAGFGLSGKVYNAEIFPLCTTVPPLNRDQTILPEDIIADYVKKLRVGYVKGE
jgi:hypothetical protein